MNRLWICNDVWMDIFPCFDHAQLGLKLALLSPRFNSLVDKHFDAKSELTIWRTIEIHRKDNGPEPKLSVQMDDQFVPFPLPDCPLPSKIRFKRLQIDYIDHYVIAFLRVNHQIFDKRGTNLRLLIPSSHDIDDYQPICNIFVREIWPIFSANIRHFGLNDDDDLDSLRRFISPTILTDLNQLVSIDSVDLFPEAIAIGDFDGPNSTVSAGRTLSKWLHSPRKDGQPKRLRCEDYNEQGHFGWVNNFKEQFLRANAISSVSYQIHFYEHVSSMPMVLPFEFVVNVRTQEKLTLTKANKNEWKIGLIMNRCKIIGETAAVHLKDENLDNNCNSVVFWPFSANECIGPLSPPPAEEEEAGRSIIKGATSVDK